MTPKNHDSEVCLRQWAYKNSMNGGIYKHDVEKRKKIIVSDIFLVIFCLNTQRE